MLNKPRVEAFEERDRDEVGKEQLNENVMEKY